jgi:DNA-binding response OmpR family regulator
MRVLLAEDDLDLLDVTSYALHKHGHEVLGVTDGEAAVERWQTQQPDLVLLDLNLPGLSGLDVCRTIREQDDTPIIMVTAHRDEQKLVDCLGAGADDYVTKPVSYRTLLMRMQAVSRRHRDAAALETSSRVQVGDLEVDLDAHECRKAGVPLQLTHLQLRILYHLANNAGRVVRTQRLIELAWGYDGGNADALKTHISNIRQKVGSSKGSPCSISAIPQVGYKLEAA